MPLVRIRGRSMTPALHPGEVVWARKPHALKRGDIVLVRKPTLLVKRIVGLPEETIELRAGRITANRVPLKEPYVPEVSYAQPQPDRQIQIPPASYFVLGDARDDSQDSRAFGPVHVSEIQGIVKRRWWPLWRWGPLAFLLTFFAAAAMSRGYAADPPYRLLAFASETRLSVMIGKYDPKHKWTASTEFYAPPEPKDPFTIYGPYGETAAVMITEARPPNRDDVFGDWSAKVSSWDNRKFPYGLAISGQPPLPKPDLVPIPLDDPEARAVVARYLKSRGLRVEAPLLTQAISIPLEGHDQKEVLLVAHSDASQLKDDEEAMVYAVALLWWKDGNQEKVFPLVSRTSFKPAGRSIDEHEHLYGIREYLRVLSAVDIDGDGWKEIALYRAKELGTQIELYTFNGRKLKRVISVYKVAFN